MGKRFKQWLVRRWLHLIPISELHPYTERRVFYEQMNKSYEKLAQAMIDNYYQENQDSNGS
jgi:hypothetical protein